MKYDAQQRKEIYKLALNIIKGGENEFMCNAIKSAAKKIHRDASRVNKNEYPEFFLFNPKELFFGFEVWFDNTSYEEMEYRKTILEFCIIMCDDND